MGANFRSDNEAPVAPEIMTALAEANRGPAHSYGDDPITARVADMFGEIFETDLAVYPLASGTAANALAVAQTTPSIGAVICHEHSHLNTDECAASEFYSGGAKLLALPGDDCKLGTERVRETIARAGQLGDHTNQPTLLSITQATEFGTVYSLEEIRELTATVHEAGMHVHMDGTRFANAICSLGCSPAEMTWRAGVDMVSFGATKNGAMMAEALLVFDAADAVGLGRRRKQGGHLLSKMRYVSAQLEAYLADDLWLRMAAHANRMARRMVEGLEEIEELDSVELLHTVQSNEIFLRMDAAVCHGLRAAEFQFHEWPGRPGVYRLVMSHCTQEAEVEDFLDTVAELSRNR
jgi:threonine aldolase